MCFAALAALPALFGIGGGTAGGLGSTLGALGTVAGAGASIIGGVQAGNVAEHNAKVAENNAQAERERAGYEANLQRENVRRVIGSQRAAGAASGLDITSGTPVAVLGDTAKAGEMDVLARLYSGEAAATANLNDAARFRAEGSAARGAGFINAGTSLLSGFGKLASRNRLNQLGAA